MKIVWCENMLDLAVSDTYIAAYMVSEDSFSFGIEMEAVLFGIWSSRMCNQSLEAPYACRYVNINPNSTKEKI